jgi:hypothetical protein
MYQHLPEGAMYHDPNAYLATAGDQVEPVAIGGRGKRKAS